MGFRWRKSFNVIPGVRINLSTSGVTTTVGGKYGRVNLSKKGASVGASIPNTGISYNKRLSGTKSRLASKTINRENNMGIRSTEQIIAAMLAFFLGTFGIHKFYTGRIVWGFIYLLFFWTGIPTFLGFIEGILYLIQSPEEFREKYGR